MPCLRSKKNRFRKSLKTSPSGLARRRSPAPANCCVVDRASTVLPCAANSSRPASVSVRRFTSANRTCSITCWLSLPPGTRSMLMTCAFGSGRRGDLAVRSITFVFETWPERIVAPSFDRDRDVFAGKQRVQLLLEARDRLLDDDVVLLARARAPDDQADRAGLLAVDQDLARLHDDGVGDFRVGDGDARDVERRCHDRRTARGDLHLRNSLPALRRRRSAPAGARLCRLPLRGHQRRGQRAAGRLRCRTAIRTTGKLMSLTDDLFRALRGSMVSTV